MRRVYHSRCFTLLLLASCGRESGIPAAPAGASATATGALAISAGPTLTIAPTDSEGIPFLGNLVDATRLPSGAIAVVDRTVQSVMLFDSAGQLTAEYGRKGAGPGEFDAIGGIGQCQEDTLFVWDPGNSRMTVLDAGGRYVRQYTLPAEPAPRYCGVPGDMVLWTRLLNMGPLAPDAPPVRGIAGLVDVNGSVTSTLGELRAGDARPLGAVTVFAVTPQTVYVGTADSATVAISRRDGSRLGAIPVGNARQAPTAQEYEAALAALVNSVPGTTEERASVMTFMRQRFPMPEFLPAYRAILVDPSGTVYVVTSPRGAGATEVAVFDGEGRSLGELRMPGDLDVVEVGSGYLLGIAEGAEASHGVVMYRVAVGEP